MINIAMVGYGYWGPNLARQLFNCKYFRLKAICDALPDRLAKARQVYVEQTEYLSDYREALKRSDVDAIAIAVGTGMHFEIAKATLEAGKHVYVEKPFTSTVEEAKVLRDLALKRNLVIHVDHIMIFHPAIRMIKKMIDSGELGELIYIDASRMNLGPIKMDVSAMWDLAVHDLSIIDYLSGPKRVIKLSALGEKRYSKKETLTFLTLQYDGMVAHIKSSWISPLKERKVIIAGTKKMVVFDDMKVDEKLMIYDKGVDLVEPTGVYEEYAVKVRTGDLIVPTIPQEDALLNSVNHFAECISIHKPSITGPDQAIRMLEILEEADLQLDSIGSGVEADA